MDSNSKAEFSGLPWVIEVSPSTETVWFMFEGEGGPARVVLSFKLAAELRTLLGQILPARWLGERHGKNRRDRVRISVSSDAGQLEVNFHPSGGDSD